MIPIIIKEFQWSQNTEWVFITVNIKGVKTETTDIVTSPNFIKVHHSPFIFELFLNHEVDDELGECTIDERSEKVSFRLRKLEGGFVWDQLENKKLTKEEKNVIRAQAVEITQQRHKKEKSEAEKRKFDRKQATVHDQIRLDAEAKERISQIKNFESQKALDTLVSSSKADFVIFEPNDCSVSSSVTSTLNSKELETVGVRPSVCIPVSFTPRIFPTPSRESTHADEQEWLKKQAEARKLSGFVDEDLRPEERNPQWLLDKGLSLMRAQSFLGAISAFSLGIRLAPKMPELFVERAGAHLAVKNYHKTVEDCSQALELLTPKVKANEEYRLNCHIRRGAAFRELKMLEEALGDYKEAILLKPGNNEELTLTHNEIQLALQTLKN